MKKNLFKNTKQILPEFKISLNYKQKQSELKCVKKSSEVYEIAKDCFDSDKLMWVEEFLVFALNRANKVLGFYRVSSGGVSGTVCDPKVILQFALLTNSSYLILAHNHPSGILKPSQADIDLTSKLRNACKFHDIDIIDHIIVSSEGYYSFSDEGML